MTEMSPDPTSGAQIDAEFQAMWDAQMLEYPTISRDESGKWHYFDVPDPPVIIDPDDGLGTSPTEWDWGRTLARQSLELAGRHYEADSCALLFVLGAAHEALGGTCERALVAHAFIEEILDTAVHGRQRAY
jgi:hypothetical protein